MEGDRLGSRDVQVVPMALPGEPLPVLASIHPCPRCNHWCDCEQGLRHCVHDCGLEEDMDLWDVGRHRCPECAARCECDLDGDQVPEITGGRECMHDCGLHDESAEENS
jgi:hypothetical protein